MKYYKQNKAIHPYTLILYHKLLIIASRTDCWGKIGWDIGFSRHGKGSNRKWNLLCTFTCCWSGATKLHLSYLYICNWMLSTITFKTLLQKQTVHHSSLMHLPKEKIHKRFTKYIHNSWNQHSNKEKYTLFLRMLPRSGNFFNDPVCMTLFIFFFIYSFHDQSVLPSKIQHCRKTETYEYYHSAF